MILQIFTVFDSAAKAYMQPFYGHSIGQAVRSFADTCSDPEHMFSKHPADFNLFHVGSFDDQNCRFEILESNVSLGSAIEYQTGES